MEKVSIGKNIERVRETSGLTQQELADQVGVNVSEVCDWENGRSLPDIEKLMQIAEFTNAPYTRLLGDMTGTQPEQLHIRDRLFREENMFTRMKTFSEINQLSQTFKALHYMRERHAGQLRKKGKYNTTDVLYINHPLVMACQAVAFGIMDDELLSAILLHDVVEDTGVAKEELPFSERIQELVGLVSFSVPEGKTKKEAKRDYYKAISENPEACLIKILDRCNNVSTMAGTFGRKKLVEYIEETEEYVLPLTDILKNQYPEYSGISFLVKYHIVSVLETVKNLIVD